MMGKLGSHWAIAGHIFPQIYDKALEIGCGKANGSANERDIAAAVNSDVAQTLKYRAAGPNVSHPLIYYSPTSLALPSCATHANLLTGVLRSIGIEATTKYVWGGESSNDALYNYTYRNASNISYRVSMRLIRNANIDVINGVLTQTEEENPHFYFHAFTQAASKVYDPSYGLEMSTIDVPETYHTILGIFLANQTVIKNIWSSNDSYPDGPLCSHSH